MNPPNLIFIIDAITAINPNAQVRVTAEDYNQIEWLNGTTPISVEDIKTKLNELQEEYDAQEYARNRQAEYPSITDVTVALAEKMEGNGQMWDEITALRLDVKSKYSKP